MRRAGPGEGRQGRRRRPSGPGGTSRPRCAGAHIGRICDTLAANKEKLARIITRETGKPQREALGEVQEAIDICAFYQSEGRRLHGQTVPSELPNRSLFTYRRPLGVCGVITPSIFPLAVPVMKILPAILCGNTVVWKPSSHTPSVAYLFGRAMMDAGLPGGVVNIVNGKGHGAFGKHFLAGIDKGFFQKFSFTGSTASGRHVGERCGRNLIPASLELGAKNPLLVMPDCDLEQALAGRPVRRLRLRGPALHLRREHHRPPGHPARLPGAVPGSRQPAASSATRSRIPRCSTGP